MVVEEEDRKKREKTWLKKVKKVILSDLYLISASLGYFNPDRALDIVGGQIRFISAPLYNNCQFNYLGLRST
jgi:hypothetical protein